MNEENSGSGKLWGYVVIVGISMVGGLVSYFKKLEEGQKHAAWRMVAEIVTSGFAGGITGALMLDQGSSTAWAVACAGIAGHMGGRLIEVFENGLSAAVESIFRSKSNGKGSSGP